MFLAVVSAASVAAAPAPPAVSAPVPEAAAREISVLTYNVRGLPWPVARDRPAALAAIGAELAELRRQGRQPDVVLLQEGFLGDVRALVRASGYAHAAAGPDRRAGGRPGKLTGGGLHVLSDLPILDVVSAPFSACAGLDCFANKGVMLVRLQGPDGPLEVVNTHLNSRRASRAAPERARRAHNRQMDELLGFIAVHATPGRPLLIGGDFNVKNAPERYYHRAEARPYVVVSEFCHGRPVDCGMAAAAGEAPWLRSQDLQAFVSPAAGAVRPTRTQLMFDGVTGGRLSDHDGYLVRYALSAGVAAAEQANRAASVRPVAWRIPEAP